MPDRQYHPFHVPPTRGDHFLANPVGVAVGVLSLAVGAMLGADAILTGWVSTISLEWLSPLMLWIMAVPLIVGGSLVTWGALTTARKDLAWKAEMAGWPALALAWAAYAIVAGIGSPVSTIAPAVSACLSIGGVGRFVAVRREYAREARAQQGLTL